MIFQRKEKIANVLAGFVKSRQFVPVLKKRLTNKNLSAILFSSTKNTNRKVFIMFVTMYNSASVFDFNGLFKMLANILLLVGSVVLFLVNSAAIISLVVAFVYYASFAVLIVGGFWLLANLPKLMEKL